MTCEAYHPGADRLDRRQHSIRIRMGMVRNNPDLDEKAKAKRILALEMELHSVEEDMAAIAHNLSFLMTIDTYGPPQ